MRERRRRKIEKKERELTTRLRPAVARGGQPVARSEGMVRLGPGRGEGRVDKDGGGDDVG